MNNGSSSMNSTGMGGMDGSGSMNMTSGMPMSMEMFFHFTPIDYLLFKAWKPSSAGAIGGACIGIFFFSILERLIAAFYRYKEAQWRIALVSLALSSSFLV